MSQSVTPPRRRPKRVLAVRMLVARIAWLDGRLRWYEGRVVWDGPGGQLAPGAAELARAQRCLYKIRRYPFASASALGDTPAWLRERQERLELAKQLSELAAPDLPALAGQAQRGDPGAVRHLVTLLIAEALCVNPLPVAPSAALRSCGERAEEPLQALLTSQSPPAGRALAALTLGALHRAGGDPNGRRSAPVPADPWLRRAYAWGTRVGLSPDPGLIVALLSTEDGEALARRAAAALQSDSPFLLPSELLRELLAEGVPASRVVALAEAAAAAGPLARRLLQACRTLPDRPRSDRRAQAEARVRQCQETVAALRELMCNYVRSLRDPSAVHQTVQFAGAMLELGPLTEELSAAILQALRGGLELQPELQRLYLGLLVERQQSLWNPSTLPRVKKASAMTLWLQERWGWEVRPLLKLLKMTGDIEIARRALELGVHRELSVYEWSDPGLYRWLLTFIRDVCLPDDRSAVSTLCRTLGRFPTVHAARTVLQPVIQALAAPPLWLRSHFLEVLLDEVPYTREGLRDTLPRLVPYLPQLLRFAEADKGVDCICAPTIAAALAIDRAMPGAAGVWLSWLLSSLPKRELGEERSYEERESIRVGVALAVTLAKGDFARFQSIFRTALRHPFQQEREALERSLPLLDRFPALCPPLARLFPQQPHRCAELLVRLGWTTRLGSEVLAPLAELEPAGSELNPYNTAEHLPTPDDSPLIPHPSPRLPPDWRELLALAPDLMETAESYCRAQELLGGSRDLPPGVRRAMDLPRRLTGELTHIERLLESDPARADLAARAGNLRSRLADEAGLQGSVRDEVRERLAQVTAEAQIAAAEQQVLACYRARLDAVAGPLPAELRFDADMVNATLLTVDISKNRRLLVRLLRAHLTGDRRWREQHPANVAFLAELAARGVDLDAWLAAHPRRCRCDGAHGGWVHLRLERDPLRILQMGNYFQTCLSFGDFNAFSTVANACELNKRVVYATDGAGRVVGRKLIAVNAEGGLVGFHTYVSLPDETGNASLRAIFRRYLADFAARCGLPLADNGTVPVLFAQDWYDDGVVGWNDEEQPTAPLKSHKPTSP